MNPDLLSKIAAGLMGAAQGAQNPGAGFGRLLDGIRRKRPGPGAVLPNNPLNGPTHFPVPDPGFMPAPPRFPGDPGIDPGMTPPPDRGGFGPVPLGGRRRPDLSRWGGF